jgi:hypothetical protein
MGYVLGVPSTDVPQCSLLISNVLQSYASAMYLGGQWAITAGHAVHLNFPYQLSAPVDRIADVTHANSFDVKPSPAASADLALLQLSGIPQDGGGPLAGIPLATEAELTQAGSAQLCGFGSNDCEDLSMSGVRRLSDPYPLVAPGTPGFNFDPATQFVVQNTPKAPLVCTSDSGGGAVIQVADGTFKLAGIITDQLVSPADGSPSGIRCVRLSAFAAWIQMVTGIAIP